MVALHPVPLDATALDASIDDADLVIALPDDAALDPAAAAELEACAEADPADAWFADIEIAGKIHLRASWSPTRLITDATAAAPLAVRAGWLRTHGVAAADDDLAFRLARNGADVAHLTAVLTRHSAPLEPPPDSVVQQHLDEVGIPATIGADHRLVPDPTFAPVVTVVVPTAGATLADGTVAVDRLRNRLGPLPDGVDLVVVVGDEYRGDPVSLEGPGITVVRRPPGPFDFSAAVNLGVLHTRAPHVLLLNDDTEPDGPGFIRRLAVHLADPTVAAVGAMLTYPDGTVQHAGIVIDDARPLHPFVGWQPADTTPHGGATARDVVAVTGACLMVRRADFLAVGGLSTAFPLSFNDIDLCIRLRRAVGRVVVEPAAVLVHHETLTRAPEISLDEWNRWIGRWGEIVDPWYHPGHHRPDDPHRLARNADHLAPRPGDPPVPVLARRPVLRSRVHRGRPAVVTG